MTSDIDIKDQKRLVKLLEPLAIKEGPTDSILNNVWFFRTSRELPRLSLVYIPSILILAQGRKIIYLGDEVYRYDPNNYLVIATPLPVECEHIASPEEPALGMGIEVNPVMISELLMEMDSITRPLRSIPRGVYSAGNLNATSGTPLQMKLSGCGIFSGRLL